MTTGALKAAAERGSAPPAFFARTTDWRMPSRASSRWSGVHTYGERIVVPHARV